MEDQAVGYSANLPIARGQVTPSNSTATTIAELGLMAGAADPMMLFPAGTTFTPYSVLRNVSDAAISVTPTLWWMAGAVAHSAQLAPVSLPPHQTHSLDVMSLMTQAGLTSATKTFNGSFNLVFDATIKQGDLLLASGSVDQTNTYVFEVVPRGVGESGSKSFQYWSTGNGDDTMVTLWNPADEAQDFVLTLFFALPDGSRGHYVLPIHLEPRATRTLNASEIVQNQIPDAEGNTIPASVHEGSAILGGAQGDVQHILVAVDSGTYNVRKATCGVNCVYCDGYTSFAMIPGSATFAVQATKQYQFIGTYSNGSKYNVAGPWSSSKTSVATVGSSTGVAMGVAGGTANFITSFNEPIYQGNVCSGNNASCSAFTSGTPSGGGNIVQITNVNPSQITLGTSGPMTITGTNFNLLGSTMSVSTDGGVVIGR